MSLQNNPLKKGLKNISSGVYFQNFTLYERPHMVLKNKPAKFRDLSHFFAIPKSERFLRDSTFYMVSSSVCFKPMKRQG